jgi:hypothetical protein
MLEAIRERFEMDDVEPGERTRRAARALHDALGRVEATLEQRRTRADAATAVQLQDLARENDLLKKELQRSQAQHQSLDGQVKDISRRLEVLIGRVGSLLSE